MGYIPTTPWLYTDYSMAIYRLLHGLYTDYSMGYIPTTPWLYTDYSMAIYRLLQALKEEP